MSRWRSWGLGFLFWTAVALFFSTQRYLALGGGGTGAWGDSLRTSLPQWYCWGLLSPFVILGDRWAKSGGRSAGARVLRHVPLAILFVTVYVVLRTAADELLGTRSADWSAAALGSQVHWNLLIYAVMVGAFIARDAEREARERKLRAAELETRLAEARLESLKAQLRPHFLFNTLNAISAFMEKDPKTARRMTAHLGDLLRYSLDSSNQQEVPFAEELGTIEDYLAIQQIRFSGKLDVEQAIEPETLTAAVPPFILQPLVENAIEHGLTGRASAGRIFLKASRRGRSLELSVSDDGVGLGPTWKQSLRGNGNGFGIRSTTERLQALYGDEARVEIRNGAPGGVTVTLTLPWRAHG
jgi:two-component system, LytTR family, sensor kinase